jgi:hypothetical protein
MESNSSQPFSLRCMVLLVLSSYFSTPVAANEWTGPFGQPIQGNSYFPSEAGNPVSVPGVESFFTAPNAPTVSARLPGTARTSLMSTAVPSMTVLPNPFPSQSQVPAPTQTGIQPAPAPPASLQPASQPTQSTLMPGPPSPLPTAPALTSGITPAMFPPRPASSRVPNSGEPPLAGAAAAGAGTAGAGSQASQANVGSTIGAIIGIVIAVFGSFAIIFFLIMRRRGRQTMDKDPEIEGPVVQSVRPYIRNASRASSVTLSDPPVLPRTRPVMNPFLDPTPPLPLTPGLAITTPGQRESATYLASPTMTYVPSMVDQRPYSEIPQPPVIIRTMARKEEAQTSAPDMQPLPENLGRLNQWLEENRRRSRMTASSASASIISPPPNN